MRSVKRILALLLAAFLAFAPPGTLIFLALLILAFVRTSWVAAAAVSALAVLAAVLLLIYRAPAAEYFSRLKAARRERRDRD